MNRFQRLRSDGQDQRGAPRARNGFSLVEVLVSIVLLGVGILGVSSAGTAVNRQLGAARGDLHLWAAMQTVGDSLKQSGYGAVTAGSRSIGTYSVGWSVSKSVANLDIVTLGGKSTTGGIVVADTILIYLGNPNAP